MFHKIKSYIQTLFVGLSLLPSMVLAEDCDPKTDPYGYKCTGSTAKLTPGGTPTPLPQLIGNYIQIFLSLLGVVFLILMLVGGFRWMKARGEAAEVTKAKEIIMDAVIGLIIVAASYAITAFVINAVGK